MQLDFIWLDVFTERPFQGNALAVFPEASGLSHEQMQSVARELNLSETTFVVGQGSHGPKVRIFTPEEELAFAGHPTLGTAVALHGMTDGQITLDLGVGPVPVDIRRVQSITWAELKAPPARFSTFSDSLPDLLSGLGLGTEALDAKRPVVVGSCGTAFVLVGLEDAEEVARARLRGPHLPLGGALGVVLYALTGPQEVHARVFVPGSGVPEDPATGSANAPLAAYLHSLGMLEHGQTLITHQGIEMKRPSLLKARVERDADGVLRPHVCGAVVEVARGRMRMGT